MASLMTPITPFSRSDQGKQHNWWISENIKNRRISYFSPTVYWVENKLFGFRNKESENTTSNILSSFFHHNSSHLAFVLSDFRGENENIVVACAFENDLLFSSFHKYVNFFGIKNFILMLCQTNVQERELFILFMDKRKLEIGLWHEILSMAGRNDSIFHS